MTVEAFRANVAPMTTRPASVAEIIGLWPSAEILADDLGFKYRSRPRVMKHRGRIPRDHWDALVEAAERRGIEGVTLDVLESVHRGRVD